PSFRRSRRDDRAYPGLVPVTGVVVGDRDRVAVCGDLTPREKLLGRDRVWRGGVGRSQQARAKAYDPAEGALGHAQLEFALPRGERGQIGVRERMVAEFEAVVHDPPG